MQAESSPRQTHDPRELAFTISCFDADVHTISGAARSRTANDAERNRKCLLQEQLRDREQRQLRIGCFLL